MACGLQNSEDNQGVTSGREMFPLDEKQPVRLPALRQSVQLPTIQRRNDFINQFKYDPSVSVSNKARIKNALQKKTMVKDQRNFQMNSVEVQRKAAISSIVDRFLEREASHVDEQDLQQESEERAIKEAQRVPDHLAPSSSAERILEKASYVNMVGLMGTSSLQESGQPEEPLLSGTEPGGSSDPVAAPASRRTTQQHQSRSPDSQPSRVQAYTKLKGEYLAHSAAVLFPPHSLPGTSASLPKDDSTNLVEHRYQPS